MDSILEFSGVFKSSKNISEVLEFVSGIILWNFQDFQVYVRCFGIKISKGSL
jgi:hypothetical protein